MDIFVEMECYLDIPFVVHWTREQSRTADSGLEEWLHLVPIATTPEVISTQSIKVF